MVLRKKRRNTNKHEKEQVINFAKSLIHKTSFTPEISSKFIDLLIETSLAAAFYDIHKDQIEGKFKEVLEKIHKGIKAQNKYHENTLQTLKKSNLKYYLLKDSAEPWDNRYSCDVDILVPKKEIESFKLFLSQEAYLINGEDIVFSENLTKQLFKLNINQTNLEALQIEKNELYHLCKKKQATINKTPSIDRSGTLESLSRLQKAEKDYLFNLLKINKFIYKKIDSKRNIDNISQLLKLNSRIHMLCTISLKLFPKTITSYNKYDKIFFNEIANFKKENINYAFRKESEFLDIKTKIPALGMANPNELILVENKLAPVDNLILNASHFFGNIKRKKSDYSYQGFLKYLIDGAFLIKNNKIDYSLLRERALKFNKTTQLKYYLYLLNTTSLADIKCDLPNSLSYQIYKRISINRLLFNENNLYILIVKKLIFLKIIKRKFKK